MSDPTAANATERTRRVSFFYSVDDFGDADDRFGCAATDEESAARFARYSKHGGITLVHAGPVPLDDSPGHNLDVVLQSPLLGADWIPLAMVITQAAEASRSGSFWRMDTYAPQAGWQPGPSPFVQGLTEFDGTHLLEVGGLGRGAGWTSEETHAAFALLGWSMIDDPISPNLTLTLPTSWTGERVARLVLEIFVSIYGHDVDYPVAFETSHHVREFAAANLLTLDGGEIFVNPAARARWVKSLATRGDASVSYEKGKPGNSPSNFAAVLARHAESLRTKTKDAIVWHRLDGKEAETGELLRLRSGMAPSPPSATCTSTDRPARHHVARLARLFSELASGSVELKHAAAVTAGMAENPAHPGVYIDLRAALVASNPHATLDAHAHCGASCVLRSTPARILLARCSDDERTVSALRNDQCELVRTAARNRHVLPSAAAARDMTGPTPLTQGGCGLACVEAHDDMIDALRDTGLAHLSVPVHMRRYLRKRKNLGWSTHEFPPDPAGIGEPDFSTYGDGPAPDHFSVEHVEHIGGPASLNVIFCAGKFAFHGQALWSGEFGDNEGRERWEQLAGASSELLAELGGGWDPHVYRRRDWAITFSRDGHESSPSPWAVRWIGGGDPPRQLSSTYELQSLTEVLAILSGPL